MLGYRGACTHSPLVEGFKDPVDKERTKRRMRANFERLKETKSEEELVDYCERAALSLANSKAPKDSWRMRLKAQLDAEELAGFRADVAEKQRDYRARRGISEFQHQRSMMSAEAVEADKAKKTAGMRRLRAAKKAKEPPKSKKPYDAKKARINELK